MWRVEGKFEGVSWEALQRFVAHFNAFTSIAIVVSNLVIKRAVHFFLRRPTPSFLLKKIFGTSCPRNWLHITWVLAE